jgi:hypothetical protein
MDQRILTDDRTQDGNIGSAQFSNRKVTATDFFEKGRLAALRNVTCFRFATVTACYGKNAKQDPAKTPKWNESMQKTAQIPQKIKPQPLERIPKRA